MLSRANKTFAVGCLLIAIIFSGGTAFLIHRAVDGLNNLRIEVDGIGPVFSAWMSESLQHADKQDRLKLLEEFRKLGPEAVTQSGAIELLLNDPDEDIRAAAVAALKAIDPAAFDRATGPPAPAMPRTSVK